MTTLGSFSVPFDSRYVVLLNSLSIVVADGEKKLSFDVSLLRCLAEALGGSWIILRFAVSVEGGQSAPESFLATKGHGISHLVAGRPSSAAGAAAKTSYVGKPRCRPRLLQPLVRH